MTNRIFGSDLDQDIEITKNLVEAKTSQVSRFVKLCDGMPRSELEYRYAKALCRLVKFDQSKAMPGLGWDCPSCKAFNGSMKEVLPACQYCDAPNPYLK
jgi:hypothetical protein